VQRLRDQAKLEFLVEPPVEPRVRLDLTDVPVRGPENARVTLVHFASFGSPLSARSAAQLARLATEFPDRLRFAYRTYLGSEPDDLALAAAELAVAAQQSGRFWEAHDRLFAEQGELSEDALDDIAADLEVERKAVGTDAATRARIRRDEDAGNRVGVKQEPTIFVNGRLLIGTVPYDELRRAVAEELGRQRSPDAPHRARLAAAGARSVTAPPMGATLTALAGFAAWYVVLTILMGTFRMSRMVSAGKAANSFAVNGSDLPGFGERVTRARDNCYETLPIFGALALVAYATNQLTVTDPLAMWVLWARIGQSVTHMISTSVPAVLVRANLFFAQMLIYLYWSYRLLA
jgi:protein-disulfide isomerase/uncharacterized MAPEG superfamily protein